MNQKVKLQKTDQQGIVFVLQYFYPEIASTAQLMTDLAEDLSKRGIKVKVIAGQPTYVRSKLLEPKESFNGIEIERVHCTRFEKNSYAGRLMNWASYTFLVFTKLLFLKNQNPLFIVSTPPFLFVIGFLLNIIRRKKYICLVYDLYPEIAEKLGYLKKGSLFGKIWKRCNRGFFTRAEQIIVPSVNMKLLIEKQIADGNSKINVIHNWADENFIKPLEKKDNWFSKKFSLDDKLTILYAGNMGLFHQLETLIDAAEKLKDKPVQFVFIGEGGKKRKLMELTKEKKLGNVLFLPYQDKEVLPYSLTCADISVVSLEKGLDCVAAPCKLYTSLAAGQIILGLVDDSSDVARLVNEYKCGFSTTQDNVDSVVNITNRLLNNPELVKQYKANARRCFEENFQKKIAMQKYYDLFLRVM